MIKPLDPIRGESGLGTLPIQRRPDSQGSQSTRDWAGDFLYAGFSALLMSLVRLSPDLWWVSFVALTPLLFGIIRRDHPRRALRLGFLFGFSFLTVCLLDSFYLAPVQTAARIVCGTALFAIFGWGVAWGRRRWGFNPLIIALLWIVLEWGMIRLGFSSGIFGEGGASGSHFGGMTALFGFLSISFLIVLLNALLIHVVETAISFGASGGRLVLAPGRHWCGTPPPGLVAMRLALAPEERAPPYQKRRPVYIMGI